MKQDTVFAQQECVKRALEPKGELGLKSLNEGKKRDVVDGDGDAAARFSARSA